MACAIAGFLLMYGYVSWTTYMVNGAAVPFFNRKKRKKKKEKKRKREGKKKRGEIQIRLVL